MESDDHDKQRVCLCLQPSVAKYAELFFNLLDVVLAIKNIHWRWKLVGANTSSPTESLYSFPGPHKLSLQPRSCTSALMLLVSLRSINPALIYNIYLTALVSNYFSDYNLPTYDHFIIYVAFLEIKLTNSILSS